MTKSMQNEDETMQKPVECRKCGLLKSTVVSTGHPCIDRKGAPHDFCEKVGDKEICALNQTEESTSCPSGWIEPKLEEEINELIRDLTKIGSIPKSEAKRRINQLINQAKEESYRRGYQEGINDANNN